MYEGKSVAVVITAYNEAGFVGEVIDTLPAFVDRGYAIDDASTDGTWEEIQEHATDRTKRGAPTRDGGPIRTDAESSDHRTGDEDQRDRASDGDQPDRLDAEGTGRTVVVPIRHEQNRGAGAAVKTGYKRALADGMDVIAVMDGDGQMNPDILDRIIDPVVNDRAEYAKGNRLLSREHARGMSRWRRFGNACLTGLTKLASGYWKTMDPQNGYTAISRAALIELDIDGLYDDYGFLNDLLVKLNAHSMRVADVEMQARYADESSSISYVSFIPKVSNLLARDFLWRLKVRYLVYDFHPLVLLYALGAMGSGSALAQFAAALLASGSSVVLWTSVLLTSLLSGFSLTLAMAFDLSNSEHLERQEFDREERSHRHRTGPAMVRLNERGD